LIAENGINRYSLNTFNFLREMHVWVTGNGVTSARNVMNHLPLIKKSLCKKNSLHNAEIFLSSRPSHSSPAELNIRLLKQKAKKRALHQSELNLASKGRSISSLLNSHLAKRREQAKRLHSAQITSIIK